MYIYIFKPSHKYMFIDFREKGKEKKGERERERGRERERERNEKERYIHGREKHGLNAFHTCPN